MRTTIYKDITFETLLYLMEEAPATVYKDYMGDINNRFSINALVAYIVDEGDIDDLFILWNSLLKYDNIDLDQSTIKKMFGVIVNNRLNFECDSMEHVDFIYYLIKRLGMDVIPYELTVFHKAIKDADANLIMASYKHYGTKLAFNSNISCSLRLSSFDCSAILPALFLRYGYNYYNFHSMHARDFINKLQLIDESVKGELYQHIHNTIIKKSDLGEEVKKEFIKNFIRLGLDEYLDEKYYLMRLNVFLEERYLYD